MPSAESAAAPLTAWPTAWGDRRGRRNALLLWGGPALLAIAAAMIASSVSRGDPVWPDAVVVLLGITVVAAAARRPFGRGPVRLVETAAVTRGRVPSPDLRVHFVPERPAGVASLLLWAVWALVFTATTIVAVAIGIEMRRPQAFLGAVIIALFGALCWYAAVRGALVRYRSDSVGRGPAGVAIGADGVTVIRVREALHLPWTAIRGVDADTTMPRPGAPQLPLIRLRVDPERVIVAGSSRAPDTITVMPAALQAHPHVVWSALHAFHREPSRRKMLGTPSGDQLFDEWCSAALS